MIHQEKTKNLIKEFIIEFLKILIISLVIVLPIRSFLIQPFYVKGASMEPSFHDYEYLIIDEITFRFRQPQRGEIIVFHPPHNDRDYYIKRVIGLPGERILIKNGEIFIYNKTFPQGIILDESSYLEAGVTTPGQVDLLLGSEEYFVLGDNRHSSLDSRSFGPVAGKKIIGRVWLRGWPLTKIGKFEIPLYNF
ncbi:MAG: signal peptidase I [Patescibacteria group bacterium]|nr:signal peptidase I [Patescibacteria group bacterium]